jgi:hypothetical protein
VTRALVVAAVLCLAAQAEARSSRTVGHPSDRVWPSLVRFLRVDEKVTIVEKDADAAYVLFQLVDEKKTFDGSAELVKRKDEAGRDVTHVVVTITGRPAWMEEGMLDRFERKVQGELGEPPPPPKNEEKAPAPEPSPDDSSRKK